MKDCDNIIVVAGSGRSGAVGIGNIIAGDDCRPLFEPFDERAVPELAGFGLRPYLRPDGSYSSWQAIVERVFSGQIRNPWIDKHLHEFDPTKDSGTIVVKEIRANGILGWLDRNFPCKIVYLLRHPCAVIASRIKLRWDTHIEMFLNQPKLMDDYLAPFQDIMKEASTETQKHAVMWCAENLIPLRQITGHHWNTCFYEKFEADPEKESKRLLDQLGLEFSESRRNAMRVEFARNFATPNQLHAKWKTTLSVEDRAQIADILAAFKINIYSVEAELPIAERLF